MFIFVEIKTLSMKKITLLFIFIYQISFSQTPCDAGFAGIFPCDGLDLMSFIPVSTFGSTAGNDIWGWTDPVTNKEYALFGDRSNTAFLDVTDPVNPIYLGKLDKTAGTYPSTWRDIKVYNNYAFIVSEASGHGMQVFDLTKLRNVVNPPVVFTEDAHDSSFGKAHNIVINEANGYAYIVGSATNNGGPIFINIQDPLNPVNEGSYDLEGYSHDAQVITYHGQDTAHVGKELYIGAHETSVVIIDVTDKTNPVKIAEMFYANTAYTHQVWIDENHQYLYCNDEIDETNFGFNTRNIVFDLSDLDNPVLHHQYYGETTAIDHNNYVKGNDLYLANYAAGLRIIDISDIGNQNMNETSFFDTYPEDDVADYNGIWSVYPYFASGNIIISDYTRGFFIVRDSNNPLNVNENTKELTSIYPNPAHNRLKINSNKAHINKIEILDILGKQLLLKNNLLSLNKYDLDISTLKKGFYFIRINDSYSRNFSKN